MTFATTTYRPADGGHRYATDAEGSTAPCATCGGYPWAEAHRLVEEFVPDLGDERPAFAVEVSDDHGRSYATNALRWPNAEDADRWASGLAMRWFGCTDIRVVACDATGEPDGTVVRKVL